MRITGKICCYCHCPLDPPYPGKERSCSRCDSSREPRCLCMQFEKDDRGWQVSFHDLKASHARFRKFTFAEAAKVEEVVARTATRMVVADWHAFENGLTNGSGAVTLTVTEEQYQKLLR